MAKVVVVTGATAGIGRATVREFARQGAHIGLIAREEEGLHETEEEVTRLGGKPLPLSVDVARSEEVDIAAERIERELGPVSVWVNNAMTTVVSPFAKMTSAEFRRVNEVTYFGTVHGTMAALRYMLPRDKGVIVQVGSALAYRSIPLQAAYCGAKHGVVGFTDSIRSELIHDKSRVHITAVHLPAMNTPQFSWARAHVEKHPQPLPPIYQPEVAAWAILWAASHRRREIYVGAPTATAIIWNKFFPGLLDRVLAKTAYEGQMTDMRVSPVRPDNLFYPSAIDHNAHGIFNNRAKNASVQLWATTHLGPVVPDLLTATVDGARQLGQYLLKR